MKLATLGLERVEMEIIRLFNCFANLTITDSKGKICGASGETGDKTFTTEGGPPSQTGDPVAGVKYFNEITKY